ncbi:hypothetical protein SeF3a_224 [Salmonella phage SeF3a]|nr:hypothetical protein SeF3a_224 [Salmonella phage SeF3a]
MILLKRCHNVASKGNTKVLVGEINFSWFLLIFPDSKEHQQARPDAKVSVDYVAVYTQTGV